LRGESKESVYLALLKEGCKINEIETAYLSLGAATDNKIELHEEAQKKTIKVVVGFGITLIAAGIFSIIASNWQDFSKTVKILIIYFFFFASYFGGWRLTEFYQLPKVGRALYYLGSLIFGSGIMLIGQMFNVTSNWPDAFLIWMLGTMAAAYFTETFGLFFLALPIGLVAMVGYPITFFSDLGMFSGHNPLIMTSTFFLFFVSLITFATGAVTRRKALAELLPEDNY
jgi:uncharacterized membrane protein